MRSAALASVFILAAALLLPACPGRTSEAGLPIVKLDVGGHTVRAEVARTVAEQSRGLMYRRELGKDAGMIFVYEQPRVLSFWMKNTFVPLTIAWIDSTGTIVGLADMVPQDEHPHRSPRAASYALEMRRGWFAERGVSVGDKVRQLPPTKTP